MKILKEDKCIVCKIFQHKFKKSLVNDIQLRSVINIHHAIFTNKLTNLFVFEQFSLVKK